MHYRAAGFDIVQTVIQETFVVPTYQDQITPRGKLGTATKPIITGLQLFYMNNIDVNGQNILAPKLVMTGY